MCFAGKQRKENEKSNVKDRCQSLVLGMLPGKSDILATLFQEPTKKGEIKRL